MSGWTILTVRGRAAETYEHSDSDSTDSWPATADIVATMDKDDRIRRWTVWKGHVYAYLNMSRYDFDGAESVLADYQDMVEDAVVLGANDTTDIGTARYYPVRNGTGDYTDEYKETQGDDGTYVGEIALSVMNARHGIVARDPFHNNAGRIDEMYLEDGQDQLCDPDERRFEA